MKKVTRQPRHPLKVKCVASSSFVPLALPKLERMCSGAIIKEIQSTRALQAFRASAGDLEISYPDSYSCSSIMLAINLPQVSEESDVLLRD